MLSLDPATAAALTAAELLHLARQDRAPGQRAGTWLAIGEREWRIYIVRVRARGRPQRIELYHEGTAALTLPDGTPTSASTPQYTIVRRELDEHIGTLT